MPDTTTRTIIDLHILHTVPPSNINRDGSGRPKTAVFGGVQRSRISSQAQKRAAREKFGETFDDTELGTRTRRVVELIADGIGALAPDLIDQAEDLATAVLKAAGVLNGSKSKSPAKGKTAKAKAADADEPAGEDSKATLYFMSRKQRDNLIRLALDAAASGDVAAFLKTADAKTIAQNNISADIALFGRMVAHDHDLDVDAAVQVAHAISVHEVATEFDYFAARDEYQDDDRGAGMLGSVEFNSSTLYRYAAIDVNQLDKTLGDPAAVQRAVEVFVRQFARNLPGGFRNSFAHGTLPEAVVVVARDTQALSYSGAFAKPVRATETAGYVENACAAMTRWAREIEDAYGETPLDSWVVRLGDETAALDDLGKRVGLNDLVSGVGALVAERHGAGR